MSSGLAASSSKNTFVSDLRPPGGWKLETSNTRQLPVRLSPLLLELTTDTPERRLAVPERRRQQLSPAPRFHRELRRPQPTNDDRPLAGRDFVTFLWPGEAPATAHALVPVVQVTENPSSKVPRTGIGGSMPASEVLVGRGTQHISGDGGGHVLGKKGVLVPEFQNLSATNTKHPPGLYITRWLLLFRS